MLAVRLPSALRRVLRTALAAVCIVAGGAVLVVGTYRYSYCNGWQQSHHDAERRLEFLSRDLASALDKYETLPTVLAGHPALMELLQDKGNGERRQAVNELLDDLARETRVAAIHLMDPQGTTLAASNWSTPRSFVAKNYAFRPYFRQSIEAGIGRYYAVGVTTGEPGYFLARAVGSREGGAPLGVVAVKILLDDIESNWARSGERLMLADAHGVVFLASHSQWKFRTLEPLPTEARQTIRSAQQYGDSSLDPLIMERLEDYGSMPRVHLPDAEDRGPALAVQRRAIGRMGWTLLSLSDAENVARQARNHSALVAFACGFVLVGLLYAQLRRSRDEERLVARRELERADTELEQRIEERTAVLTEANRELASKLAELDRTQATLQATQNELVQACKLAVLGQMAASITHEINQPLTALRALNDNAVVLLERSDPEAVRENLREIDGMARRIGSIVSQLKGFARKDGVRPEPVRLRPLIDTAIALVAADARREGVRIEAAEFDPRLAAQGQSVRIEQVLVNLLRNAIDAARHGDGRLVEIGVHCCGDAVRISIADRGPGIAPEARERLFEPFFTTKTAGEGLGLGLAISASIANALGGTLEVADRPGGGAISTLRLRPAQSPVEQGMLL